MIRYANEADTPAIRALWELCFPDESGFNDYFFAHLFQPAYTLLSEQDGTLCAMVQMLPYTLTLGGETGTATYIYGACTHPDHRRKHLMAQLLEYSFAEDRRQGRVASLLIPQEEWLFDFYRPFGYLPAFSLSCHTRTRGQPPATQLRPLTGYDQAAALYEQKTREEPVRVLRSKAGWERQLSLFRALGAGAFGLYEDEQLTAYAFVWREDGGLYAQELLAVDDRRADLLCQALLHRFNQQTIKYCTTGSGKMLGCLKPYRTDAPMRGYINLMLN